jgi:UPF0716 protein FxsA
MRLGKWLALGLLLLLLGEIAAFLLTAALFGALPAFALLLGMSLAGVLILRQAGRTGLSRLKTAARRRDIPELLASQGRVLTLVGAILLALPGFLTGFAGLALMLPPLQRWLGCSLAGYLKRRANAASRAGQRGRPAVIDLKREEWEQVPEARLPPERPRHK